MGQAGVWKLPEAPVKRLGPHILAGVGGCVVGVVVEIVVVLVVGGGTVVGVVGRATVGGAVYEVMY